MQQYHQFLRHILDNGVERSDRTGTGTISTFAYQMRFDISKQFPLVTTKKVHLKSVIHELLWFLQGNTNVDYLQENGVRIWNEWADENGELGPVYGKQWRAWRTSDNQHIDQISNLIEDLKTNPHSRRHIVSAWNVGELDAMALPPCHMMFQCFVANNRLSCQLYQRSADAFLGVPFNIASYAMLTYMLAAQTGLDVGDFIWTGGDCHIYTNHLEQVNTQLSRTPYELPTLRLARKPDSIFDYTFDDFIIENYTSHPTIKAPIAV